MQNIRACVTGSHGTGPHLYSEPFQVNALATHWILVYCTLDQVAMQTNLLKVSRGN